jgi:hypothetical protein
MKKIFYLSILIVATIVALWLKPNISTTAQENLLPAGEMEEGGKERAEWELERLADPRTGRIPAGIRQAELAFAKNMPHAEVFGQRSGGTWQTRGPWNIGGRTRAMTMDITNEKRIIAGSVSGGLFITEDDGASWTPVKGIGNNLGVVSLSQDKRAGKTNIWYAMTGEAYGTSASGGGAFFVGDGMFKSIDNGLTWTSLASTNGGAPNSFSQLYQLGWKVLTDPTNLTEDVVYMATYGGIYRSKNGGVNWTLIRGKNNQSYSYFTDITITTTGVLYATLSSEDSDKKACPDRGIWRSTDGLVWTNITPANFPPKYDRIVIGINPNNENEVYFLGNTDGYGHSTTFINSIDWSSLWKYTYASGNGAGANGTWANLTDNLPNKGTQFDRFSCQGGYDLVVKVQPKTNAVFIGGSSLYRSTDGFATPNNTTQIGGYKIGTELPYFEIYPSHHPDQHDIIFSPSDNKKLYSASDGGINVTDDCNAPFVNWKSLNNGYITTQLYTVNIEHSMANDPTLLGGFQDNGNFFVGGKDTKKSWVQTVNGDGAYAAITNGKKNYYLSIQLGKMAKCELDANGKVLKYNRIDPIGGKGYQFINPFVLDPNNESNLYLAGGKRLWRNNQLDKIDLVGKWDSIATGWFAFPDTLKKGTITSIAVSSKPSNRVYFGSTNGKLYRVDNAQTDTAKYKEITVTGVTDDRYLNCITIDPDDADNVIVTYSNYTVYSMFQTKNGGKTWTKVAGNLEANTVGSGVGPSIRWVSILRFPSGAKKYFAATSVGLYSADSLVTHTNTTGTKWVLEGADAIGNVVCNHIDTRSVDGLVAVATHGAGAFTANFQDPGISNNKDLLEIKNFTLYPNPASDVLYWNSDVELSASAKITIYDMKGAIVKKANAVNNQLIVSDLPKGIYVFQLRNEMQQALRKLIIK